MALKHLVAARIRQARRERDLNQTDAGNLVGLTQQTWASYETGNVNVPLDTLEVIAGALHKPIEFFVVPDYEFKTKGDVVPKARTRRQGGKKAA